jgi:hypothetical protein
MRKSQLNTFDSLLPPSKLPMDLTKEEGKSLILKRVLPEMDLSEWETTCRGFCPRRGKQNDNNDKKSRQQASKPKERPPRICYKCRQPGHYANSCPNPRLNKPRPQRQGSKASKSHQNKKSKMQGRQYQRHFMGSVSSWEHLSLLFAVNCWFVNHPLWTFDGNVYAPRCPKLPLLATSFYESCWPCNLERLHLDLAHNFMNT